MVTTPVNAGPYADDLSRCLVESTSSNDRAAFVRWMFAAGSAHPAVQDIANVSPEALESANKGMADMFMRLMTELCRDESKNAFKYEGQIAFQLAFKTLGEVAGTELFGSPEVTAAMGGFESHLDSAKLEQLTQDDAE